MNFLNCVCFPLCLIQHTGSVYAEVQRADDFSQPAGPNLRGSPRHSGSLASRVLKKKNKHTSYILYKHTRSHTHIDTSKLHTILFIYYI